VTKARYTIEFARSAEKDLDRLSRRDQGRVLAAIAGPADRPRPPGCRKITGAPDAFRIRVGVYRVVYVVRDDKLVVVVIRVGHRRDVYRQR